MGNTGSAAALGSASAVLIVTLSPEELTELVLDPAVTRSAAWRAHWADAPAFDVVVEDDQIVLRRRTAD